MRMSQSQLKSAEAGVLLRLRVMEQAAGSVFGV